MSEMFDMKLRAMRRDRAARTGHDFFLLDRAFGDCLDRLDIIGRRFGRALLLGCPDPVWPERLRAFADYVSVADPGALFAQAGGGRTIIEDDVPLTPSSLDLVVSVGTLDTVNGLQPVLHGLYQAIEPDGAILGAISGGDTLPLLRGIMAAVDRSSGHAIPRVHPRIEASMLAPLLEQAGFVRPVVDIDRVNVSYESLDRLVEDLRSMAATNILAQRSRTPITRQEMKTALAAFDAAKTGQRAVETFEILHFAAWRPATAARLSPKN
jgi:NADH dehydrogenase [ubiquinone] 1 alpha subcomplex assembly factor 5